MSANTWGNSLVELRLSSKQTYDFSAKLTTPPSGTPAWHRRESFQDRDRFTALYKRFPAEIRIMILGFILEYPTSSARVDAFQALIKSRKPLTIDHFVLTDLRASVLRQSRWLRAEITRVLESLRAATADSEFGPRIMHICSQHLPDNNSADEPLQHTQEAQDHFWNSINEWSPMCRKPVHKIVVLRQEIEALKRWLVDGEWRFICPRCSLRAVEDRDANCSTCRS